MLVLLTIWSTIKDFLAKSKSMHQVPCSNCQFFTSDYRLKCTVHPSIANSERAINCRDYEQSNVY